MLDLSIIIPTYNEGENPKSLAISIHAILKNTAISYDIWFMDDSTDNTPQLLEELAHAFPQIHHVQRTGAKSLGRAVEDGIKLSTGHYLIIMDADLQHPPAVIVDILIQLQMGYDIVIPSRFIQGGFDGGLNIFRKLISFSARMLGRFAIKKIRNIHDCTSGFFGFDRDIIKDVALQSISWKILMEILVKGNYSRCIEIPYHFKMRRAGVSKMTIKEQWRYLVHIAHLRRHSLKA